MERQPEVLVEVAARLLELDVGQARVVRPAGCDHYVVDRCRHLVEEPLERSRSVASKAALVSASSSSAACRRRSRVPTGEDQLGPLSACSSAVSSPMPELPPITTTVCPRSWGSRRIGETVVAVVMLSSAVGVEDGHSPKRSTYSESAATRTASSGEEREGPPPCSGRRRRRPPPDCCRSDARSGRARTSPTSGARRASSRSGRGAPPSRGGARQGLRRPRLVLASTSTRGREAASVISWSSQPFPSGSSNEANE